MEREATARCMYCGKETDEQYDARIGKVAAHFNCLIILEMILALWAAPNPPNGWKVFGHPTSAP